MHKLQVLLVLIVLDDCPRKFMAHPKKMITFNLKKGFSCYETVSIPQKMVCFTQVYLSIHYTFYI